MGPRIVWSALRTIGGRRDIAVRGNIVALDNPYPLNRLRIESNDKIARLWHYISVEILAPFSRSFQSIESASRR